MKNEFMKRAIELSIESVNNGGGPFGCVIVKDDCIISAGCIHNQLIIYNKI